MAAKRAERLVRTILALSLCLALPGIAAAQKDAGKDQARETKDKAGSPLGGFGGASKEPIKIDADRLDVFDKENKAIFAGNVVAVQGDATIRCSALTVHYKRGKKDEKKAEKESGDAAAGKSPSEKSPSEMAENGIRKVECAGPVTVVQKDQVATGDEAVFDQEARRIVLTGNVVLSQCQNVTRGSRLVYDMNSGRANMDPGANGRVSAMFVPGEKGDEKKGAAKGCAQPPGVAAKAADKPADKPAGNPSPGPSPKSAEKSAEKSAARAAAKPSPTPVEANADRPPAKTRAQAN